MVAQYSVLPVVESTPPAKGKLPTNGQSSADDMRKFEREMDKVQADERASRNSDRSSTQPGKSDAPAKRHANSDRQASVNPDQNAQNPKSDGEPIAADQSISVKKSAADQAAGEAPASKSEVPAEIANLTNWQFLEQVANKRDDKNKTGSALLMDSVAPKVQGETPAKTGKDHTILADIAAQIKSIGNEIANVPATEAEGEIDLELTKQLIQTGEKSEAELGTVKIGNGKEDAAISTEVKGQPVIDAETTSTKTVTETGIVAPNKTTKTIKSDGQSQQNVFDTKSGDKTIAAEQVTDPNAEAISQNDDVISDRPDANVTDNEEQSILAKAQEPAQQSVEQSVEQSASTRATDTEQPDVHATDTANLSDDQLVKADTEQVTEQSAKPTPTPTQNAQATTDATNQNTQSQSALAQSSSEGTTPATQSKEALAAQRAASDPDQKQATSEDNPSDAAKSEIRTDARSDKSAPTVNDRQEQLAKLRAPKGAIFSELMAGVKADAGQMTDMDGANDLFDPTLEMDLSNSMSQDRSVRLTGFDAFAKTGNLPTSASLANAQAIAAQISRHVRGGENRFEIRLDPAELGKIDVKLTIGSDGQARAHLFVERPETMDFLMRDQRMLERTLQQSGLQLEDKGLEFSLMDQGDQNQQWAEQQNQSDDDIYSSSSDRADNTEAATEAPVNGALAQNYVATDGVNLVI